MLNDLNPKDYKNIYIVCGFTDMRYGINGLSAIIEQKYKMNVFIGKTLFMTILNNDQLNTLDKDAMALIIKTLQSQLMLLESTNKKLMAQIDALTAQIRLSNQRAFDRKSEKSKQ